MKPSRARNSNAPSPRPISAAGHHQHEAFRNELPHQARMRGTQRTAHGDLPPAALRAHQQQARHVDARDHQQQRRSRQQQDQQRPHVADNYLAQRLDNRTLSAIRVRILLLQGRRDRLHLRVRLGDVDSVLQASDADQAVAAAPQIAFAIGMKRGPEQRSARRRKQKVSRQHADDGVGIPAERDRLSDDILPPAKEPLPRRVTQHDGARRTRQVLALVEMAAENWRDAERLEEAVGDARALHDLRAFGRRQHVAALVVYIQRAENVVAAAPVEQIVIGKIGARNALHALGSAHQTVRRPVRQRLQQSRIHEREDSNTRPNAQRQHHHRREREGRVLEHLPHGKAQIHPQALKQRHGAALPVRLLRLLHAAQLHHRRPARLLQRHARAEIVVGLHFEMAGNLGGEVALTPLFVKDAADTRQESSQMIHGYSALNVIAGSMFAALRAGIQQAATATASRAAVTPA